MIVRKLWVIVTLVILLAAAMSACSATQPVETPVPLTAPSPTPSQQTQAPPTILPPIDQTYSVINWETLNGWTGKGSWDIISNKLVSDGKQSGALLAPFLPAGPDYVVSAKVRVVSRTSYFGVVARADEKTRGYLGGVNSDTSDAVIAVAPEGTPLKYVPFTLREGIHLIQLKVQGNTLTLIVDGTVVLETMDNQFLNPGHVGVWNQGGQIEVSRFSVAPLP